MIFVNNPNLPEGPVKLVIVDGRISAEVLEGFSEIGISIIKTREYHSLYKAVSFHADIMLHHTGGNRIVYAPGVDEELLCELRCHGFRLISGQMPLSPEYPLNIAYNVARVGKIAFHNLKYTDPVLRQELENSGVELVHVKQGYAKCSVSIVDDSSIITADKSIAAAAGARGLDVLLVGPEEKISLPGLNYGFIGGCTGLIDKNKWAITGDIASLASASRILAFLAGKNIAAVPLAKGVVTDIGSIIPLMI